MAIIKNEIPILEFDTEHQQFLIPLMKILV